MDEQLEDTLPPDSHGYCFRAAGPWTELHLSQLTEEPVRYRIDPMTLAALKAAKNQIQTKPPGNAG